MAKDLVKVENGKYGKYIKFQIEIEAWVDEEAEYIGEYRAKKLAMNFLEEMAGCNDGSELLANAKPIFELVESPYQPGEILRG